MNKVSKGTFTPTSRIIAHGNAGNDTISVSSNVTIAAWIYGDSGNNSLSGGGGPTYLFGGTGTNTLFGGKGRTIMIGGAGRRDADQRYRRRDYDRWNHLLRR